MLVKHLKVSGAQVGYSAWYESEVAEVCTIGGSSYLVSDEPVRFERVLKRIGVDGCGSGPHQFQRGML